MRQRFAFEHEGMSPEDTRKVEDATRQWFRLAARHPKAKLSMPSVAVDAMWHEMVLHTREYQEFCDQAFGHLLHHQPESAMNAEAAAANRAKNLQATFRLAREDERCDGQRLPLLFRVDRETRRPRRPALPRRLRGPGPMLRRGGRALPDPSHRARQGAARQTGRAGPGQGGAA